MSDEEDTFLALKRLDIADVSSRLAAQYTSMKGAEISGDYRYFTFLTSVGECVAIEQRRDDLLYSMGWTHAAFVKANRAHSVIFDSLCCAEGVSK